MNRFVLIAAVVVVLVVVVAALRLRRGATGSLGSGMEGIMQGFADQAVLMADKGDGISLDYSPASIEKVEQALGKSYEEGQRLNSSAAAKPIAIFFGAYIGEVIRRSEPDSGWLPEQAVGKERLYPLRWLGGEHFPVDWCYRRLVNGPQDSVWVKYTTLKQQGAVSGS
jgi:hypothetical protein